DFDEAADIALLQPMLVQPDGRFDFAGVPPGQYVLRVGQVESANVSNRSGNPSGAALAFLGARGAAMAAEDQTAAFGRIQSVRAGDDRVLWAEEHISVGEGGLKDLRVQLRPSLRISGRMQFIGAAQPPAAQVLSRLSISFRPYTTMAASLLQSDLVAL